MHIIDYNALDRRVDTFQRFYSFLNGAFVRVELHDKDCIVEVLCDKRCIGIDMHRWCVDKYVIERGRAILRPRHYILTGAYLKYWGSYAQEKAYIPSGASGSPKVKLHSDVHRISVSL